MSIGACSAWKLVTPMVSKTRAAAQPRSAFPRYSLDNLLLCIVRIVAISVGHLDTESAARTLRDLGDEVLNARNRIQVTESTDHVQHQRAAAPPALPAVGSPPLHPPATIAAITARLVIANRARQFLERMINSLHRRLR